MENVKALRAEIRGVEEDLITLHLEKKMINRKIKNKQKEQLYKEQACERALVTALEEKTPKQIASGEEG